MTQKSHISPLYFDPIRIGQSLKEVGIDYLKVESKEIETRWFQHLESETDVFVWFDKSKQIIKQQVNHMGHLVEWNVLDGLKTGYMSEAEIGEHEEGVLSHPASEVIHFDKQIQKHTLINILDIVRNMKCISDEMREDILLNFTTRAQVYRFSSANDVFKLPRQRFWNKLLSNLADFYNKITKKAS